MTTSDPTPVPAPAEPSAHTDYVRRTFALCLEVQNEALSAMRKHGQFRSAHEAMGVLDEEVWEFKLEVFKKREDRDPAAMRAELIQIAAVAIKAATVLGG